MNEKGRRIKYLWNYFGCEYIRSFMEYGIFENQSYGKRMKMKKDIVLHVALWNLKIYVFINRTQDERDLIKPLWLSNEKKNVSMCLSVHRSSLHLRKVLMMRNISGGHLNFE